MSLHQDQPVLAAGAPLAEASGAVILMHGRGSTAQSSLRLAEQLPLDPLAGRIAYLAPQAANQNWYPHSGFLPLETNEPYVSSAFQVITDLFAQIAQNGIPAEHVALGGFSQGACLSAEYAARHPQRYGGLFVLSGAMMGPPDAPRHYSGSLDGTPVYVGGADHDPWVTEDQLHLTARVLGDLSASVRLAVQPGADHLIRPPDVEAVRDLIQGLDQTWSPP